jgi:hypothetical protein
MFKFLLSIIIIIIIKKFYCKRRSDRIKRKINKNERKIEKKTNNKKCSLTITLQRSIKFDDGNRFVTCPKKCCSLYHVSLHCAEIAIAVTCHTVN